MDQHRRGVVGRDMQHRRYRVGQRAIEIEGRPQSIGKHLIDDAALEQLLADVVHIAQIGRRRDATAAATRLLMRETSSFALASPSSPVVASIKARCPPACRQ